MSGRAEMVMSWVLLLTLVVAPSVLAEWTPSADLRFRAEMAPDTLTIGDPVELLLEAAGPTGGDLIFPAIEDSIGPWVVTSVLEEPFTGDSDRAGIRKRVRMTTFQTGVVSLPPLPLLWVPAEGETLVAYTTVQFAWVPSVLPDTFSVADPQAALGQLRDVKRVVQLEPSRWWLWIIPFLALMAAAYYLTRWWLRKRRQQQTVAVPSLAPVKPVLPPEIAFREGLDALRGEEILERGEFKEYYARLSMLLRQYVEGRFGIPAMEETRREILERARTHRHVDVSQADTLGSWLAETDLVKFARVEKLMEDAEEATRKAEEWVEETTRTVHAALEVESRVPANAPANASGDTPTYAPPNTPRLAQGNEQGESR